MEENHLFDLPLLTSVVKAEPSGTQCVYMLDPMLALGLIFDPVLELGR